MRNLTKYATFVLTSIVVLSVYASNSNEPSNYELIAYKDCNVVYSMTLNENQAKSYDNLNEESEKMRRLERPIQKMRASLNELEEQMHNTTEKLYSKSDKTFQIDKEAIKKQQLIAHKIEKLINEHQKDFNAIEKQGHKIQHVADKFEKEVVSTLPDSKQYDHVQIFTDDETSRECESYINKIRS